ncbi:MAG: TVP38/TMEM64 family protein [Desulfobaccales bacterium]
MQTRRFRGAALIKAMLLLIFIVAAVVLVRYTGVRELLTVEKLGAQLAAAGLWAPLAFILVYAVGVCLFIPGTLLTTLGAAIYGPYWGFVYVWVAAMLGSAGAFLIGRYLGREFAASLIGDRLKKYDDAIEKNGFATVLYLRLVYFPFTPMNFGMGLTKVRFRDYLWGTGLGILVGTFIFTFFVGTIKEVWASGQWGQLLTWKIFLSLGLFLFSLFIPKIISKLKVWEKIKTD